MLEYISVVLFYHHSGPGPKCPAPWTGMTGIKPHRTGPVWSIILGSEDPDKQTKIFLYLKSPGNVLIRFRTSGFYFLCFMKFYNLLFAAEQKNKSFTIKVFCSWWFRPEQQSLTGSGVWGQRSQEVADWLGHEQEVTSAQRFCWNGTGSGQNQNKLRKYQRKNPEIWN